MTYSYPQETRRCGPAALAYSLARLCLFPSAEEAMVAVLTNWPGGWKDRNNILDDINDWPDDHRLALEALGLHQTMVTLTDILAGKYPAGTVVVLLHRGLTRKHWVVWEQVLPLTVQIHMGDGTMPHVPIDQFIEEFTASGPNAAYTATTTPPRLSVWQRVRRTVLGWWARITGR